MPLPKYYKLDLSRPPVLRFAMRYKTENYQISFRPVPNHAEFVYLQEGAVSEKIDGKELTYVPGDVYTHVHDRACRKYSQSGLSHFFTIGFLLASPIIPMTEEEVAAWVPADNEAIAATQVKDPKTAEKLEQLIKKAVRYYDSPDAVRFLRVRQTLSEIFTVMTEYSVTTARTAQRKSYEKENKYCRRACSYIAENLSKRISVEDVAHHAGISYGYLSGLFVQTLGMTLVEYINNARIRKAAQLISVYDMRLEELCKAVGISDTKYLSTLFRQTMGMTIREYKKLHK